MSARIRNAPQWRPADWRVRPAAQSPGWPDPAAARSVMAELARQPALVTAAEVSRLRRELARVAQGRSFVVQAGDCAETFDPPNDITLEANIGLLHDICRVIGRSLRIPVIPVGRIAGQYAKPRSSPIEEIEGQSARSFRGHLINDPARNGRLRVPDSRRLRLGYDHASATMHMLRRQALRSEAMRGHAGSGTPAVWTSHEALVLDYEEPLVRFDQESGNWVLTSTHLPWIGERTRQPDGAHVAFAAGIANPIGCKLGPTATPEEVRGLCALLDPGREPGRLVLVSRMGAHEVARRLPPLLRAAADHPVVWLCDPMHGNTVRTAHGVKTRQLAAIVHELGGFVDAVRAAGGWPGGLHLECTAGDVTECVGGSVSPADLGRRYETACDPRLNRSQTEDVARCAAALFRQPHPRPAGFRTNPRDESEVCDV